MVGELYLFVVLVNVRIPHIPYYKKKKKKKKKNTKVWGIQTLQNKPNHVTIHNNITTEIHMSEEADATLTAAQKKSALLAVSQKVKMGIHELGTLLRTSTPMAGQLLVTKDIEKLQRQLERVQMGLQELVL